MRSWSYHWTIERVDVSLVYIIWMEKLFRVLLCTVFFFFHCEVDDFWTFSDIPWSCLHSYQTFRINHWRISCCNETEKQLLQQWNVQVWNHNCTEQEVFPSCLVTLASPQSQRRVCCRSHQDTMFGIAVWWVFHFHFLSFARSVLITVVECQQHSLWMNETKWNRKKEIRCVDISTNKTNKK